MSGFVVRAPYRPIPVVGRRCDEYTATLWELTGQKLSPENKSAITLCRMCPAITSCLADAVAENATGVIRGGVAHREKRHGRAGRVS